MRSLSVKLDDDTFEALEMERRLIGFDSRAAYVRWIVDHRASIADELDDGPDLLEGYRERIATLEGELAALTSRERPEPEGERPDDPEPTSGRVDATGSESALARDGGVGADGDASDGATASADDDARSVPNESRADGNGWTRAKIDPSVQVRGSPRTTVSRDRPAETASSSTAEETADQSGAVDPVAESNTDPGRDPESGSDPERESDRNPESESAHLSPERVVRIPGDPVSKDADVLETVEFDRLDELSRRAVAKTRSRLDRPVETGLEYRSSTTLVDETIRPGEDVVDLDSLSVPGRDDDVIEARREVAGRAIAFLRDEERARKSDFVDALYAASPAGYETADSWWACLKGALKQVDAIEGGDGSRVWRFTG
ncbi:hypothetical protein [Halosolutus halophilus]|uniref:hypothetical protein n=1 Tax=Halosolutus halophilus TaxID=1552990 RepID=UPI0022350B8E|nr:hypothetical protein [Halosolutus halophilus]